MGRLDGIQQAIGAMFEALGIPLPSWGGPALAAIVVVMFLPGLLKNARVAKARRLMSTLKDLDGPGQRDREQAILALVRTNLAGLASIGSEAHRKGHHRLAAQALQHLEQTGKRRDDVRRLQKLINKDKAPKNLHGEVVAIERLWAQGLHSAARNRLAEAQSDFPDDPTLEELASNLPEAELTPP